MIDAGRHIDIMGIVNLTDDSFFSESRCGTDPCQARRAAMARISDLIDEGADIIDLGACSTRPGSLPVGPEEEWRRLGPVLKAVVASFPEIRVSIDTIYSEVVANAYEVMASAMGEEWTRRSLMVNDISAGEDDPLMLETVAGLGLEYIAMHKRGTSVTMQQLTDYNDVVAEVKAYFDDFAIRAQEHGLTRWILDPGFGFAKTLEQNYELMRSLNLFSECGSTDGERRGILVGVSRKSMIYKLFGMSPEEVLPETQVLHLKALQNGADILRVHDVAEAVRTVALYRLLR
jgi:dihydropteroate synthase